MFKKTLLHLSTMCLVVIITGCKTQYEAYSPGENLQALTNVTESDYRCDFPFGGDNGRNLFFTVYDKRNLSSNIFKKEDPYSASMSQKTSGKNQNMAPSYCATTDKVAFAGRLEGAIARDIYIMGATEGNALTQITNTPDAEENYPCISRDGKFIVYEKVSLYGRLMDTEIWIKNLETNENTMLGLGRMPSFSPDGQTIAFIRYTTDGEFSCLWTMKTNGTNQVQLTDANMGVVLRPCFSPDAKKIAFQCFKRQKKDFDLYTIDVKGNNLTQLTINKSYDGEPYWSNDGQIYFTSDRGGRDGNYQIWRFKAGAASDYTPTTSPTPRPVPQPSSVYHEVSRGETISQVAQRYGVTARDIVKWNNLKTMTITPGMRLKVSAE